MKEKKKDLGRNFLAKSGVIFTKNANEMLKCEWFDKLIAECEAKANKKFDVHETMFAVDYAVALLDGDVENEYVDQTVDECRGAARDCP